MPSISEALGSISLQKNCFPYLRQDQEKTSVFLEAELCRSLTYAPDKLFYCRCTDSLYTGSQDLFCLLLSIQSEMCPNLSCLNFFNKNLFYFLLIFVHYNSYNLARVEEFNISYINVLNDSNILKSLVNNTQTW